MKKAKNEDVVEQSVITVNGMTIVCCDTIGRLDHGFGQVVIDEAIAKVAKDLDQRGEDEKVRTVTIKLMFWQDGDVTKTDFEVDTKLPPLKLRTTSGYHEPSGRGNRQIVFREKNPDRPDQPVIEFNPHPEAPDEDGGESDES